MAGDYLKACIETKRDLMIRECNRIIKKLGYSELETNFPKVNHSLVATKEFVFITGGSYNQEDKTFEILTLSNDSIFRGPDLVHNRQNHASFVIDSYLYIIFGSVLNSYWQSMSYERIEIPSVGCKEGLEDFYRYRRWESFKIDDADITTDFMVFNSFKAFDNKIYCFGEMGKPNKI
jgi:hypothetical protein